MKWLDNTIKKIVDERISYDLRLKKAEEDYINLINLINELGEKIETRLLDFKVRIGKIEQENNKNHININGFIEDLKEIKADVDKNDILVHEELENLLKRIDLKIEEKNRMLASDFDTKLQERNLILNDIKALTDKNDSLINSINLEILSLRKEIDNLFKRTDLKIEEKERSINEQFEINLNKLLELSNKKFEALGERRGIVVDLLKKIAFLEGELEDKNGK